jgi:NAD(P)-dependent dehydrogenase (short-subunit alcohol dehydrogenase family)
MGASPSALKIAEENREADRPPSAALVTGSSAGIGVYTAEALVRAGYSRVFCLVRSPEKGEQNQFNSKIVADLEASKKAIQFVQCDLSSLDSVDKAVAEVCAALDEEGAPPLTTVICNAGVMFAPYKPTVEGLETHIGVNHVAHVVLVEGLFDRLVKAGTAERPSRVVMLSSMAHRWAPSGGPGFNFDNFRYDEAKAGSYSGKEYYGQSKLSNLLHARWLQGRFDEAGAHAFACSAHPGVIPTELGRDSAIVSFGYKLGSPFMRTIDQGAATSVHCALTADALKHPGAFFDTCAAATPSAQARAESAPADLMAGTFDLIKEVRSS